MWNLETGAAHDAGVRAGAWPGKRVAGRDGHGQGGKGTKLAGHGKSVAGPRGRAVGRVYEQASVWDAYESVSAGACADERTGRGISVWRDGARPWLCGNAAASGVSGLRSAAPSDGRQMATTKNRV